MKLKSRPSVLLGLGILLTPFHAGVSPARAAEPAHRLSLAEALGTALANNLDLVSARMDPQIAAQGVVFDEATFDPDLSFRFNIDETEQTPVDPTQPNIRKNRTFSGTINQELGWGADYSATLFTRENDAPGFNSSVNPFYSSGLDLRFGVPLLRGLGREPVMEQLLLAQSDLKISREELDRRAQEIIETVEGAYWDAFAAVEALGVERNALERADELLELNKKKVEVGTLAPIEITQAEAGVAAQEEGVIVAETVLANAEDVLRRLMAVPPDDPMWSASLELVDRPVFTPLEIDLEQAIDTALANRPELVNAREEQHKRELSERAAHNRVRHGLDLDLRYAPSGDNVSFSPRSPLPIPGVFLPTDDGYSESFSEIFELENYTWSAGLTYSMPIGNNAAKSTLRTAELNSQKGRISVQNTEQTVRVEVRAAVREVESGIKRVEAAKKNVELQEKKLAAEQKKFQNGMSTSFEVLTFQNDLADAELGQIRAALNYIKSLAALERSRGTLLEARGLRLEE